MRSTGRMIAPLHKGILLLVSGFLASPAAAQSWIQLNPIDAPPAARAVHTAIYDPATNRMIVFGGRLGPVAPYLNDVWVLSNASGLVGSPSWIQLNPTGGPPPVRGFHSAVYDAATNRMVVFGGGETPLLHDVWVLSNANGVGGTPNWTQLTPTGTPPSASHEHSAVYDATANRMVVFGGFGGWYAPGGPGVNETWVLTNANGLGGPPEWIQLAPMGAPPPKRWAHTAVYDPGTNRMVVFGGRNGPTFRFGDVWVLTNASGLGGTPNWTQLTPAGVPPPARSFHTAIYDPATNRMVVFGGEQSDAGIGDNIWVLTNANGLGGTPTWIHLNPTGGPPTTRWAHTAIYDPATNRMVVFDGMTASGPVNDVWALTDANGIGVAERTFFLHGSGANANPPTLFLDSTSPTATTAKYSDSPGIKLSGGNLWKEIGAWNAAPALTSGAVSALRDLQGWIGLKNSDDQGTRFDLRAELYWNATLMASGETYCIQGVTRNPDLAKEVTVAFSTFTPLSFNGTTDVLSLKMLTRIGTDGAGVFCGGHSSAVGLRFYFDSAARASMFGAAF